jgi:hypothetical protein
MPIQTVLFPDKNSAESIYQAATADERAIHGVAALFFILKKITGETGYGHNNYYSQSKRGVW